jgi:hypothetical protein
MDAWREVCEQTPNCDPVETPPVVMPEAWRGGRPAGKPVLGLHEIFFGINERGRLSP